MPVKLKLMHIKKYKYVRETMKVPVKKHKCNISLRCSKGIFSIFPMIICTRFQEFYPSPSDFDEISANHLRSIECKAKILTSVVSVHQILYSKLCP